MCAAKPPKMGKSYGIWGVRYGVRNAAIKQRKKINNTNMGLDMYLKRIPKGNATQQDVTEHWERRNELSYEDWQKEPDEEECYWRKFNALHNWMVDNVQGGEDECLPHLVTREHLEKLLEMLLSVNEGNAPVVFPTSAGFFFGGTDYEQGYFEDVAAARKKVQELLDSFDFENYSLYYRSCW